MDSYPVNNTHPRVDVPDSTTDQLVYQIGGQLYFVSNDSISYEDRRNLNPNLFAGHGQGTHTWHIAGFNHLGFSVEKARELGTVEAGGHRRGEVNPNSATFNLSFNRSSCDKAASEKFVRSVEKVLRNYELSGEDHSNGEMANDDASESSLSDEKEDEKTSEDVSDDDSSDDWWCVIL